MKVIQRIRDSRTCKLLFTYLALNILFEIAQPSISLALTSGPSQPEVQSFEPVGTTDMVDVFTGDFNYNIPLMNIPGPNGGYPINLAYHAGITMDEEASWVGLGWNINNGALVRDVRGLPDDFNSTIDARGDYASGDYVERKIDQRQSVSFGLGMSMGPNEEAAGAQIREYSWQFNLRYNNYRGLGYSVGYGTELGISSAYKAGLSLDSDNGLGVNVSYTLDQIGEETTRQHTGKIGFSGSQGLSASLSHQREKTTTKAVTGNSYTTRKTSSPSRSSSLSYNNVSFNPSMAAKVNTYSLGLSIQTGMAGAGIFFSTNNKAYNVFFSTEDYDGSLKSGKKYPVAGYEKMGVASEDDRKYYTQDFVRQNDGMLTRQTPVLGHSYYAHDNYNFTGQGIAGYFRGRRSDVGRIHDPHNVNHVYGFDGSLEMSFPVTTTTTVTLPASPELPFPEPTIETNTGRKIGIGVNFTYGWNSQGVWDTHNNEELAFQHPNTQGKKENFYYQVHGQPTVLAANEMAHINGESVVRPKLTNAFMERGVEDSELLRGERVNAERVVRNTLVHSFNNSELSKLPEFASVEEFKTAADEYGIHALSPTNSGTKLTNASRHASHTGGYKVLKEDGSHYVYGLPAYNQKEVNSVFTRKTTLEQIEGVPVGLSMDGAEVKYKEEETDKFIRKTTQSPYVHSYMLTSILGADYVDIEQNGPTDDDLGYWVKFSYIRYANNYKWRAPYYGALLNKGARHTLEDDKASYTYGEKDIWYLGKIETKTHIAIYHLKERKDNAEASGEYSQSAAAVSGEKKAMQIDHISLYVKSDYLANGLNAKPLQEVYFKYNYQLCPGAINSRATGTDGTGKLTLSELWFTAQGSKRGELNKYKFSYNSNPADPIDNPSYAFNAVDGWGGYKPGGGANTPNKYFPYVDQFNQWTAQGPEAYQNNKNLPENAANKLTFKQNKDKFASAWCLKKIELPSGGVINVDYESDDYGYVQDQEATQMFKITDVNDEADGLDKLYDEGGNNFAHAAARRIYFKLEYPIKTSVAIGDAAQQVYDKYVAHIIQDENGDRNLFFKAYVQLKDLGLNAGNDYEAVSGYLPLEEGQAGVNPNITADIDGVSCYTHGFVTVKQLPRKTGGNFDHHPISLMAWQYMQTNTPKLLHNMANLDDNANGFSGVEIVQQVTNLLNVIPAFFSSIGASRGYARMRNFAKKIDLDRSVIRLCSPDKIKYGGGHRVRKITISDSWSAATGETNREYGTEYDYTMKDTDGSIISSGVAQYEPGTIGDENALKYPLHFHGKQTFVSNNNLFAEHPFNEDLFPGASVGYRSVSVKSVHTGRKIRNEATGGTNERAGGVTVYRFYTAKEFPTITEYTPFTDNAYRSALNLSLPIPLIGSYNRQYYHASQGFKIELNDMHGKPKSIESYELASNYAIIPNAISSETYEYQMEPYMHHGHQVFRLNNKIKVISRNNPTMVNAEARDMGVEYDMFTDQRQTKSHIVTAGLEINLDFPDRANIAVFIPTVWPAFTTHKTLTRTYVTNKVIFKTGILKRTVKRDLQASSSSEIVAYDELSGQPLISKGVNEFGDAVYSYNIPAYWNYDRMGHAYRNINYSFSGKLSLQSAAAYTKNETALLLEPEGDMLDMLVRGDELLFTKGTLQLKAYYADLVYDASGNPKMLLYTVASPLAYFQGAGPYVPFLYTSGMPVNQIPLARVVRSGRRNHYDAIAATYVTKGDVLAQISTTSTTALGTGISTPNMNNVLAANATVYRDDWDNSLNVNKLNDHIASNPFLSGNSGIWRPYKSYTYAGSRSQAGDLDGAVDNAHDPDLRNDGLMQNVPMFSWDLGNMEEYVPKWEWGSEVTRFNRDSYEVENVDRLGVRSSALFGMGQNLSIAVGGNADYHEMGVMDFESAVHGSGSVTGQADPLGLTNMLFYETVPMANQENYISESVKIKDAYREGIYLVLRLDLPRSIYLQFKNHIDAQLNMGLISKKTAGGPSNESHYLNGAIAMNYDSFYTEDGVDKVLLRVVPGLANGAENLEFIRSATKRFYGRATFQIRKPGVVLNSVSGVTFTATKAHTGKQSMKLNAGSNVSFTQKELRLKTRDWNLNTTDAKKYLLSMWVSRDASNVYRYTQTGVDLVNLTGATVLNATCSKVIEGWQKIDVAFTVNADYDPVKLNFTPGAQALYIDDIRISPYTGGMTTSVYDPTNFLLRASLNVDNYATLYYYDEQGKLVLCKQETENGIVTLKEARSHGREQ